MPIGAQKQVHMVQTVQNTVEPQGQHLEKVVDVPVALQQEVLLTLIDSVEDILVVQQSLLPTVQTA